MIKPRHPNVLGDDPRPLFFPLSNAAELGLEAPDNRRGTSLRTWVRAMAGMQKEALVINGASGQAWRLVSDEGPYLSGWDVGPCPLSLLTTGMVASYMTEIRALATMRGIVLRDIRLTLDNRYTMEGSLLRGTMTGGALAPELHAEIDASADSTRLQNLVIQAIDASPINGLARGRHTSLFTLSHNGREIAVGNVAPLGAPAAGDPDDRFPMIRGVTNGHLTAVRKLSDAARIEGALHEVGSSFRESQRRELHVRGVCTLRADGIKEIEQALFKPIGSTFRFLSDEAPSAGGRSLAPDAATYLSAGIGFCFMTQFGRYAEIVKKPIDAYRVVQDTHFSLGGASGDTGVAGVADAVETHVYLTTEHDDDFARKALDISEQTCFLHAFCRTDLKTKLRATEMSPSPRQAARNTGASEKDISMPTIGRQSSGHPRKI